MPLTIPKPRTTLLCTLLLFASVINYMDRQALANLSPRIVDELKLDNEQYASVESVFGFAFAAGSVIFGFVADGISVRWLYPVVLLAWSAAGIATGDARNFTELLYCRMFLGFFEAGHWPCAMQTVRRVLDDADRGLGNSVLQSGTSIGAVITPLIIKTMPIEEPGGWRRPFVVLGAVGILWVFAWLGNVRSKDVGLRPEETDSASEPFWPSFFRLFLDARFWVLLGIVIAINTMWQFFRAWLPLFMVNGRGYSNDQQLTFNSVYYVFTDIGCLSAGMATKWLHSRGRTAFRAQRVVYTGCAMLCALSLLMPFFPKGPLFLATWLVMGMGALGVFPCYYSFTQSLSVRHPAKVFGILSALGWVVTSVLHKPFGGWVDRLQAAGDPHAYDYGLAIVGLLPLAASLGLWLWWPAPQQKSAVALPE